MTPTKDDALRAAWVLKEWCTEVMRTERFCDDCIFYQPSRRGEPPQSPIRLYCLLENYPECYKLPPKPTTPDKWEALKKWALGCMDQCGELNLEEAQVTFAEVLCEMDKLEGGKEWK